MNKTWEWENENEEEQETEIEFDIEYTPGSGPTFWSGGEQDCFDVEIISTEGDLLTPEEEERFIDYVIENWYEFQEANWEYHYCEDY